MKNLKLSIDLLPKGAWGNDFSKTLSKKDWDVIRNKCYKKANYKCQICGCETKELNAHEVWDFNIETKTQKLIDIVALCNKCHGLKHLRNTERLGYGINAKNHFMKVNNCNEMVFTANLAEALLNYEARNQILRWEIVADLSQFGGGEKINIAKCYIPIVSSPYSDEEINMLKNEISFLPRILHIDINNYEGAITIKCDRTNKIEWFDDKGNKLETKFNFSENFTTKFSVKNLKCSFVYFKLTNGIGTKSSKKFLLSEY